MFDQKNNILNNMVNADGSVSFLIKNTSLNEIHAPSFADALDKLLNIKFFQLHYYDFAREKGSKVNKISRDIIAQEFIASLYQQGIPDTKEYYYWTPHTNGLPQFIFSGHNEQELLESFFINYRNSCASEMAANENIPFKEYREKLSRIFIDWVGLPYMSISKLSAAKLIQLIPGNEVVCFKDIDIQYKNKRAYA